MFCKDIKVIVCSPNGDTVFFSIFTVLQGDILASFLFLICLDYIFKMSIDSNERKWFHSKKKTRSRQYPSETVLHSDYAEDLAHLPNRPA